MVRKIQVHTKSQGLHDFTREVENLVQESGVRDGLCTVFVQHTSASLTIQENADPDVQTDMESFLRRLVPEGDPIYTHTAEGPDDMPAHIKAALTATCLTVPIQQGILGLGTWQGIYLWEHRHGGGRRNVLLHVA